MEKDKKNGNNGNGAFTVFATSNRGMIQYIIEEFYRRNRNMDKEDIDTRDKPCNSGGALQKKDCSPWVNRNKGYNIYFQPHQVEIGKTV